MIIGYIGMGLLLISYSLLLTKYSNYFIKAAAIASLILTTHAVVIKDVPFFITNAFITGILVIKWIMNKKG